MKTTVSYLRKVFDYDPDAGILIWKERDASTFERPRGVNVWNARFANTEAGCLSASGYIRLFLNKKCRSAHRIIWALHYGKFPKIDGKKAYINHIDGNRSNNAITNLEVCTHADNCKARHYQANNKTGYKGVRKTRKGRFEANIWNNGVCRNLGVYDTAKEANRTYIKAAKELFGNFAVTRLKKRMYKTMKKPRKYERSGAYVGYVKRS